MPQLIDQVTGLVARVVLRQATVEQITTVSDRFRVVRLATGPVRWGVGDKVQVRVGGVSFRTFTPFAWDDVGASLLVYGHSEGPATRWLDGVEDGQTIDLFGPRRSLDLSALSTGPLLIGDETSFALAAAWARHGGDAAADRLFEVTDPDDTGTVLDELGLGGGTLVTRATDDAHHAELTARAVELVTAHPEAPVVLTGKAQTIRAIRGALKDAGLAPSAKVKAYWDPNRSALD